MDGDFAGGLIAGLNRLRAARARGDKSAMEAADQCLNQHVGSMETLFRFLDERRRQVRPSLTVEQIIEWVERESRRPSRWSIATWGMMSEDFEYEALRQWLEQDGETQESRKTNRVLWNEQDPAYYPDMEAIEDAYKTGHEHDIESLQELDPDRLKRLLRSAGCTVRYMSRVRPPRGRIHKADWQRYLKLNILEKENAEKAIDALWRQKSTGSQ